LKELGPKTLNWIVARSSHNANLRDGAQDMSTLKDRQVAVRYSDSKLNNGKTFYFADGVITKIEGLKKKTPALKARCYYLIFESLLTLCPTPQLHITFHEDNEKTWHHYNLANSNADCLYGIGIYRHALARSLQCGQSFKELLAARQVQ
jgi:hypothetical protein